MSSTVRSYGLIALLAIPLSEDVREDPSEMLWDADTDLDINYSGNLDLLPDLLPDWAYGVNQAKDLEVGTQLCTKDGRRCGNARIMEVKRSEEPMSFLVRTDAGSEMVCTVNEIHEIWTIGPYFIKPVQAL